MSELNRLPPAIREDYRYLKFRVHAEENVEIGDLVDAVWEKSLDFLGTSGSSQADFWIVGNKFNEEKQEGIVKVRKEKVDDFRAALCLVEEFNSMEGFIEVKRSSGSIDNL